MINPKRLFAAATLSAAALALSALLSSAAHAVPVSLPLTTGASNKLNLGFFAGGTAITLSFTGSGDMVDARFQTRPDGSLFAPASGVFTYANNGAAYPSFAGGNGINNYVGGGANYDNNGGVFPFAGPMTTDTTDPATIRIGAVVATFVAAPLRANWLFVGNGATLTVPAGGANLFLAINDSNNTDNNGSYSGEYTVGAVTVPESGTVSLLVLGVPALGLIGGVAARRRRDNRSTAAAPAA